MAKKIKSPVSSKALKVELPSFVPRSIGADRGLSIDWLDLSQKLAAHRTKGETTLLNKDLSSAAKKHESSPLQAFFTLWQADNESFMGNYKQALPLYEKSLLSAGKEGSFHPNIKLLPHLLEQSAATAAYSGNHKEAASLYKQLLKQKDRDETAMLIAARYFEEHGDYANATTFYKEAAGKEKPSMHPNASQFAIRGLERMNTKEAFFPSVAQLKDRLITALTEKNSKQLESLLSKSHCSLTLGGSHMHFVDDRMRINLLAEVKDSTGEIVRYHMGMGEKCYVYVSGFKGKLLIGDVGLLLTKSAYGWQWSGFILTSPPDKLLKNDGTVKAANNITLPFPIKAPWPAGKSFMAGGLSDYIAEQAFIIAAGALTWPLSVITVAALTAGFAAREEGFGLRGYYYDNSPTHDDNDYYAIDFTRYKRYVPYYNESGGTPVLAVADGTVTDLRGSISSGDSSNPNFVKINHLDPATNTDRFYSRYLHLSGPNQLSVSLGAAVRTGYQLGKMNDTGTSVIDHLHFSIHDMTAGNQSIKPSPMDGVTLDEGDSGKLVYSTNTIRRPPPPDNSVFVREQAPPSTIQIGQTYNVSVTMRNTGPNTWPSNYLLLGVAGWNVTQVRIGRSVAPGSEITVNFQVVGFFPGDYNYRWQMARSATGRFGQVSPLHRISVESSNGQSTCADLNQEIESLESIVSYYQEMIRDSPGNKAEWLRMIRNTLAQIQAVERQKERLGCD